MEITYKETQKLDVVALQELFLSVNWESAAYPERLQKAIANSHAVVTAWDGDHLVGLVNCISDGYMTAYFHWLLVRPDYQGEGIGKHLLSLMLERYKDIPTKLLVSYKEKVGFYESLGFAAKPSTPMYFKQEVAPASH